MNNYIILLSKSYFILTYVKLLNFYEKILISFTPGTSVVKELVLVFILEGNGPI